MTVQEIKDAVDRGETVCWHNPGYVVSKDKFGRYIKTFTPNGHCIGLTWADGTTLNGNEEDFFILKKQETNE